MEWQKEQNADRNKKQWELFLSSIKKEKNVRFSTKLIDTKSNAQCLANEFADKLFIRSGGTEMNKTKGQTNKPSNETETNDMDEESLEQDTESEQSDSEQSFRRLSGASDQFPERNKDETLETPEETETKTSDEPQTENDGEKEEDDLTFFSKDTPADKIVGIQKTVQIPQTRTRSKNQKSQIKSDIYKSCSKWTVPKIAEYFDFQKTVREMKIPTDGTRADQENMLHLKQNLRVLQRDKNAECNQDNPEHAEGIGSNIKSITVTECGTRMVLDALLIPLCISLGLKIEVDKNINCTYLPNCRFDYCISKEGKIIGCVEAKSITSLDKSSVAQALLELVILQTNLIEIDARHIKCPVFAIVTDGHRFIYIQLLGSELRFEHKGGKVEIHEIICEDDVYLILQQISYLIEEGTAAMCS